VRVVDMAPDAEVVAMAPDAEVVAMAPGAEDNRALPVPAAG
jgi:hypothetical protein